MRHVKWTDCTGTMHLYRVDSVHCERLYPIVVNKYNWVLLCDNVRVKQLFPDQTVIGYQWYKYDEPIPDAVQDNYSEQKELYGKYQLRLQLSNNEYRWSNILVIGSDTKPPMTMVRIYNTYGHLLMRYETENAFAVPALPSGIYLIQRSGDEQVWTDKIFVP